jgi:hypothetical protein
MIYLLLMPLVPNSRFRAAALTLGILAAKPLDLNARTMWRFMEFGKP